MFFLFSFTVQTYNFNIFNTLQKKDKKLNERIKQRKKTHLFNAFRYEIKICQDQKLTEIEELKTNVETKDFARRRRI